MSSPDPLYDRARQMANPQPANLLLLDQALDVLVKTKSAATNANSIADLPSASEGQAEWPEGPEDEEGSGDALADRDGYGEGWTPEKPQWEMKELKPLHRNVASLFAQGMKNIEIAAVCGITPSYVSMLLRQPLVKAYIADMCEVVGTRMEALFAKSVDVLAETMEKGSEAGKLKAVRLQLEATKRVGRPDPNAGLDRGNTDRLEKLAERLILLQTGIRQGRVFNEDGSEVA